MADITLILDALRENNGDASGALLTQVYAELRTIARAKMARERPGHTLQPTALVHEAWLRLGDQRFANRAHSEQGLDIFTDSVSDIKLHLETYSYSGN